MKILNGGRKPFHRRNEAVAALGDGFDIARNLRIVAQSLPEFLDCGADSLLKIHEGVGRPEFSAN
ncbi:MAG: hypothetical protein ACREHV_08155, partial [Rhizomicrobium sp.]